MELIRVEDLRKTYRVGEVDVPVLRGVSLSIRRGEMVALMGASGSGKTTLMNILGCLDHPTSGRYWLDGEEMSPLGADQRALVRSQKIGFVFQNFNLLARATAVQNVMLPLDYAPQRSSPGEAEQFAGRLLERVGLGGRVRHEPSQMSGGQQQRVAIARALVNRPSLLLADEPTGNLDSRTSVEILEMFQQLNAAGITVVLVTHDPKVAAYAHRTIRVVDGMIESDETGAVLSGDADRAGGRGGAPREAEDEAGSSPGQRLSQFYGDGTARPRGFGSSSFLPATWRTALGALRRNKMRSGLSALGVIISVAAVIAMTEIGEGSKAVVQKGIASMGANTVMVFSGSTSTGGVNQGTSTSVTLTPDDAAEIGRQCSAVSAIAPLVRARSQLVHGNRNWVPDQISGTTPDYLVVRDWQNMAAGEMFTDLDVRNGNRVCVIGTTVRRNLFPEASPVGKELRISNVSFRVVGVLGRKGANMIGMDQDNVVLAPWTTIKYRVSGTTYTNTNQSGSSSSASSVNTLSNLYPPPTSKYPSRSSSQVANYPQPVRFTNVDQILVKVASEEKIQATIDQMTALLRERHRIPEGAEADFDVRNMTEMMNMLSATTQSISLLLLVVAMISLVVGGVGIMNIMLVSVTERTREIGLRMAVGARSYHILRQFLVEAVVLCLVGGGTGIALGRGASVLVRWLINWPTQASLTTIIAAVLVSAGVGITFGFYPAWKGSRSDPIVALRYE
ncbi:ABC transporter permease [Singulisphaera sp. Ch08]|uniref:ABC transporter permease n=1 Tax=Singulisphaera sp. Ch08 TaxID=3120278 RepID=A0AAU7C8A3_9BACT